MLQGTPIRQIKLRFTSLSAICWMRDLITVAEDERSMGSTRQIEGIKVVVPSGGSGWHRTAGVRQG
jgi:hypothetical protein